MTTIIDDLQELERALALGDSAPPQDKALIQALREKLPTPFVAHLLRSIACGRRGVALVRHGVCSECHIRVPAATLYSLARPTDLHLCENCGCYLKLDPEEAAARVPAPPAVPVARRAYRRKAALAAV